MPNGLVSSRKNDHIQFEDQADRDRSNLTNQNSIDSQSKQKAVFDFDTLNNQKFQMHAPAQQ